MTKKLLISLFIITRTISCTDMIQKIETTQAPAAVGPYSQATITSAEHLLFISGQLPYDPITREIYNDIADATHQIMKNIQAILQAANATFDNVVKTTIYLTDLKDFTMVNEIYRSYFNNTYPARETVQVAGLARGAKIEISMIAAVK